MIERSVVPCGNCKLCCTGDAILLHPEYGDDVSAYETEPFGKGLMLKHKPNGECVYLGDNGCTIYDRAPVICREFDCRGIVAKFSYAQLKKLIAANMIDRRVIARGRELRRLEAS